VFIMVVAAVVQLTELIVRRTSPLLHRRLGIYLPLITTNCAILGVALLNAGTARHLGQATALGRGAGLGFGIAAVGFASLRQRLEAAPVPAAFRGAGIALVTAGMMSLAFIGFAGLDRG